jgi:hypothetical protein
MNCTFKIDCFSKNKEEEITNISNKHTEYILKIQNELEEYKSFYDAITSNNAISKRFTEYEEEIENLKKEIALLKKKD